MVSAGLAAGLPSLKRHAAVGAATVWQISAGTLLGYALFAVLGVCVGALVRNQIAAILGGLLWTLVIEALLLAFLPAVGKWLPGGALHATLQATAFNGGALLSAWAGTAVLLTYVVVFAVLATGTTLRRDVT